MTRRGQAGGICRALAVAFMLLVAAAGVAGCGGSSSADLGFYTGTWQRIEAGAPDPDFTLTITARGDGAALTFANVPIAATAATTPASFASWITGYYATPGDPKAAANADPDGDGLKNSVEYVLGTRPDTGNQGGPVASNVGANFVFTFQRALASKNAYTKVVIEVGTDLGTWPHGYDVDTAPEVAISAGLDADHETVTLTLPRDPDTTKFARLKVITTAP